MDANYMLLLKICSMGPEAYFTNARDPMKNIVTKMVFCMCSVSEYLCIIDTIIHS